MQRHNFLFPNPLRTLALVLLLSPSLAGCMSTQQVAFDNSARPESITGVTTRSGRKISFTRRGASIANDTLYAVGREGQVILPADSIAQLWTPKFSALRTLGMVGGVTAAAFAGAAVAMSSAGFFDVGP